MEKGVEGGGRVTRFEPPRALAFLWHDDSEVTFELEEKGGQVLLSLTHRRLASRGELVNVSAGWHAHLSVLLARLRGEPTPLFWSRIEPLERAYAERIRESDAPAAQ
jgi:hypothetical protein